MAALIRHYLAGRLSNFEFDEAIFSMDSEDPSISAIRGQLWMLYDDLREHRNRGAWRVTPAARQVVLRSILFLKTDREYAWPDVPGWYTLARPLIRLLTLGAGARVLDRAFERDYPLGVWPFRSTAEIRLARSEPKYLASSG